MKPYLTCLKDDLNICNTIQCRCTCSWSKWITYLTLLCTSNPILGYWIFNITPLILGLLMWLLLRMWLFRAPPDLAFCILRTSLDSCRVTSSKHSTPVRYFNTLAWATTSSPSGISAAIAITITISVLHGQDIHAKDQFFRERFLPIFSKASSRLKRYSALVPDGPWEVAIWLQSWLTIVREWRSFPTWATS